MSAEHDSEVRDLLRQILCQTKRIDARLERMESHQKRIEEYMSSPVAEESLQKTVTRAPPSDHDWSAAEQFFSMPELLEIMLLKLPIQNLLLAQRVCSWFKATMDESVRIRRALFFVPEPVAGERGAGTPRVNPLLTDESQLHRRRFIITKATFDCEPTLPISIMVTVKDGGVGIERKHMPSWQDATCFSHGSWRKMLAVQSLEIAPLASRCGDRVYMPVPLGAHLTMEEVCNRTHRLG
ncbi:hypothetical protein BTJ68_13364 [Hortaea werneckii EXF-2000]|uniref:F-box domain-containing protein n=2 Tax=Hortaea werneckii TaxID=91943 RepID=A0A3M7IED7_HORWE|nr:hypothetical protein BTJ68_13364 [Hortaea werneckii EXF-2000]RMZ23782.1 hypothetical protein D0859_12173 [Hortaea werneckii]